MMTFFLFMFGRYDRDDINSCMINIEIMNVGFIAVIPFRLETLALTIRGGHWQFSYEQYIAWD
jgi:hypothetical protein